VVGRLVDGVAGAFNSKFHVNSVPYGQSKSRGRRFLPGLKSGVSAARRL
jgi:hypothetical protein